LIEFVIIKALNGLFSGFISFHFHKTKPFRAACGMISDYNRRHNRSYFGKQLAEFVFGCGII